MSYYRDKLRALAAGLPWPVPEGDEEPDVEHDWSQLLTGNHAVWRCGRCGSSTTDTQRPHPGRCRPQDLRRALRGH